MNIGAIGMPHSGKTLLLQKLVQIAATPSPEYPNGTKVRICDTLCSFAGPNQFASVGYYRSSIRQAGRTPRVAIFRPGLLSPRELFLEVAALVSMRGGIFVVDELPEVLEHTDRIVSGDFDELGNENRFKHVYRVLLQGYRTPSASFWWAAQSFAMAHRVVRRATRFLYVFRQIDFADTLRLRREIVPFGKEVSIAAPQLEDRFYLPIPRDGSLRTPPVPTFLQAEPADFAGRERA